MQINTNPAARAYLSVQNRPSGEVNQPVASKSRETSGKDFVVLSREAVAQSSRAAAQNTPRIAPGKALAYALNPITDSPLTAVAAPEAVPTPAIVRTFGQSDLDSITAGFGTRQGDENFSSDADANGDGSIDFRDITHVLSNWGQTRS